MLIFARTGFFGMKTDSADTPLTDLVARIRDWGRQLGFQQLGISDIDLRLAERRFEQWLADGFHGEMGFMAKHGRKRSRPAELVPGTLRIISVRMDYLPSGGDPWQVLNRPNLGYVSRYALGRDYHKLMRKRLQKLASQIQRSAGPFGYRVFVDSAPVLEKTIAEKAGLGWIGKHSNLLHRQGGCWFFLGEIYTDLPLPADQAASNHCGRCTACMEICPTNAIVAPYRVDARRCISYLTIELPGAIPAALRPLLGNRIYGCDDCLLVCPWNRFASAGKERDFLPRNGLDAPQLVELFQWSEQEFERRLEGSAIRRIGHQRWLRNIAVALGNAPACPQVLAALRSKADHPSQLVTEHVRWALSRHGDSADDR
jgi:epoxyqueuosine reductase